MYNYYLKCICILYTTERMKIGHIIERATDFGSSRSRKYFLSFLLKIGLYIIPAVILGNFTDITVQKMETSQLLGENTFYYILLQTLFIISTLYLFVILFQDYVSEFQDTIAGSFFVVLYFGMQTNYIDMLKYIMNDN